MGIPGLTTYLNNNPDIFYKDYALHDTVLLIDGNSLASQIYLELTVTNSAFGGDYERYKHSVEKFMKLLISCNILPIVVFDGGYEKRKLRTTVSRLKNSILGVSNFKSVSQQVRLFPMFMKEVFKNCLKHLQIPCVQSDLEADFDLIYLSRKLKCPILSYDSDFYINDVQYIPFFTLQLKGDKSNKKSSTGKCLHCKIYKIKYLFKHFGGLSNDFIPLLQCMLGNDYISHLHFKYFFSQLSFKVSKKRHNPISKRLALLIKWCKRQTSLESAVCKITENLRFHKKIQAIIVLKRAIKDYKVKECVLLSYVEEQLDRYKRREQAEWCQMKRLSENSDNTFEDIDEVEGTNSNDDTDDEEEEEEAEEDEKSIGEDIENEIQETVVDDDIDYNEGDNDTDVENSDDSDDDISSDKNETTDEIEFKSNNKFITNYLSIKWLVNDFRSGNLCTHVANILNLRSIYLLPLRENIKFDTVHKLSFPILKTITEVLTNYNEQYELKIYTRWKSRMKIVRARPNKMSKDKRNTSIIHICDMPSYDINYRKQFLLDNLNLSLVGETYLEHVNFPPKWNLFIISLIYWCNNSTYVNEYHVKTLIINFIYLSIIQNRLGGYFENKGQFYKKYSKKLNDIKLTIENEKKLKKKEKKYKLKNKNKQIDKSYGENLVEKKTDGIINDEKMCKGFNFDENLGNIKVTNDTLEQTGNQKNKLREGNNKKIINSIDKENVVKKKTNEMCKGIKLDENLGNINVNDNEMQRTINEKSKFGKGNQNKIEIDKKSETKNNPCHEEVVDGGNTLTQSSLDNIDQLLKSTKLTNECIFLYEKFLDLSHLDSHIRSNQTNFNKDVIHVFCEYQSILFHITMLNSILQFPFEEIDVSNIFSGTFSYNCYTRIYNRMNETVWFDQTNTLLNVYNFILNVIKSNIDNDIFDKELVVVKKRRKKKKKIKEEKMDDESEGENRDEKEDREEEEVLLDSDNIYSILQSVHIS